MFSGTVFNIVCVKQNQFFILYQVTQLFDENANK